MEAIINNTIEELDNLFTELTSEADYADSVHAIPLFRLLQLGE